MKVQTQDASKVPPAYGLQTLGVISGDRPTKMITIEIYNGTIHFESSFQAPNRDKSWTLDFNEVIVIGLINKLDGDDDSDFMLLLDKNLNKYFLSLTSNIVGWDRFQSELVRQFKIDLSISVRDNAIALYPSEIVNRPLYKTTFITIAKTFFAMTHIADGELSDEIKIYGET